MKAKFNEKAYRSIVGEAFFSDFDNQIKKRSQEGMFLGNRFDQIELRNQIESYILDKYDTATGPIKDAMNRYLQSFYINVYKNPESFLRSPLMQSSEVVGTLCPKEVTKNNGSKVRLFEEIKQKRKACFDRAKTLYRDDLDIDSLSEKDTKILMAYLISTLKKPTDKEAQMQEGYVKKMLEKGRKTEEYTDDQLSFLAEYTSKQFYKIRATIDEFHVGDVSTNIYIGKKDDRNLGGYEASYNILVNKMSNLNDSLELLMQVICHESEHAVQEYLAEKNPHSKRGMDYAKSHIFRSHFRSDGFNVYDQNYRFDEIERDAQEQGFRVAEIVLSTLGYNDKADMLLEGKKEDAYLRKYEYDYRTDDKGVKRTREDFMYIYMSEAIEKNPDYIKEYPCMEYLFESDGQRRSFEEIVTRPYRVNDESQSSIYEDFLKAMIKRGDLDNLDLSKYPEEVQANIASRLIGLLSTEINTISKMKGEDAISYRYQSPLKRADIGNIEDFHLRITEQVMNFMNSNYEHFKDIQDAGKFSSIINMEYYDSYAKQLSNGNFYKNLLSSKKENVANVIATAETAVRTRNLHRARYVDKKNAQNLKGKEVEEFSSKKMSFVNNLITLYDSTEKDFQFEIRNENEALDIKRVKAFIESDGVNKLLIQDLNGNPVVNNDGTKRVDYSQKQVSALVRLLKAAVLLKVDRGINPEGIDYLQKFVDSPEINEMLISLNNDKSNELTFMGRMQNEYEDNEKNNFHPNHPLTDGEKKAGLMDGQRFKISSVVKKIQGIRMSEVDRETKDLISVKQQEMSQDINSDDKNR